MLARHRVLVFFDLDRVQPGQYLHDAVVLFGSSTDYQDGMPTAEALGVEVSILVGQRVPLQGSQVVKIAAPVDQLHAGVIDAIANQRLARGRRPFGILEHGNDAVARPIFTILGTRDALAVRRARGAGPRAVIVTLHDCFGRCRTAVVNTNGDERAATLHALGVGTRFIFIVASLRERSNQTAGSTACSGDGRGGCKPSCRDNRPNAGDGQHAEAGEQAGDTAKRCPDTGPGSGAFGPIITTIMIPIDPRCRAVPVEPATLVVRDDADVIVWNAGSFQLGDDARSGVIILVKTRNRFHAGVVLL